MAQVIVYENGNAIGGEGHPTNASGITFDNTNSDLVSEDVESAIKEVNNRTKHGIVELWKNSNISNNFAGQSIQIQDFDATNIDAIIVVSGITQEAYGAQWNEFDKDVLNISRTFYLDHQGWNGANGKLVEYSRTISFSLSGSTLTITLSDCLAVTINTYGTTTGQTTETKNGYLVPMRILGLIHND